ncbi:MAG: hypothetical protein QXJ48_07010 [Candidatus Korarchaeum sp.]
MVEADIERMVSDYVRRIIGKALSGKKLSAREMYILAIVYTRLSLEAKVEGIRKDPEVSRRDLEERTKILESRMSLLEGRMGKIEERMERMEESIEQMRSDLGSLKERVDSLEKGLRGLRWV